MPGRNPFPWPALQTDEQFVGKRCAVQKSYGHTTSQSQQQQPWKRLATTPTLASKRQTVYDFDPQAPHDSLDFVIKSKYDQHNQFLQGNNQTLVQKETVDSDPGRVLKNRVKEVPPPFDPLYPPLKTAAIEKKQNINNVEGAIQSHHAAATNRGYSRRHDGGFYAV